MNYVSEGSVSHINSVVCSWITWEHRSAIVRWPTVKSLEHWLRAPIRCFKNVICGDACSHHCLRWCSSDRVRIENGCVYAWRLQERFQPTELEEMALCGLIIATANLVFFPQIDCVLCSYAWRHVTGHSRVFSGSDGKKKCTIWEPCLDCLANTLG